LIEHAEGKRPLGRTRRRWEDNIESIFIKECGRVQTGFYWLRIETAGGFF
jgi:hypothetical protein